VGLRALAAFKGLKGFFNTETKFVDQQLSGSASSTAQVLLLSGIAQGDTGSTRDGNSVKLVGGAVRIGCLQHTSATTTRVRVMIVADTRNQGGDPTPADIVSMSTSGLTMPNLASEPGRFVILHDKAFWQVIGTQSQAVHYDVDLAPMVRDLHLTFAGTGSTVADIRGLALYVYLYAAEATNTPTYFMASRLLYVDN
jgi:hypothetical protein